MTTFLKAVISAIGIGVILYLVKIQLYATNTILFGIICLVIAGVAFLIWDN